MNRTYTVKSGDTLWSIAKAQLGKCSRYVEIVKCNGLKVAHLKEGQVLTLPQA